MKYKFLNPYPYIAGKFATSNDRLEIAEVYNKWNNQLIGNIRLADDDLIEQAIQYAREGALAMEVLSAQARSQYLEGLAKIMEGRREDFIDLLVDEAGKPRAYARAEFERALMTLRFASHEALKISGEHVPIDYANGVGKTALLQKFPIGVVLCMTPFNFPLNLMIHKVAPALASGNAVIVKPSPSTPLTTQLFSEIANEVNLPMGAYQCLNLTNLQAQLMLEDARIDMLSFTGSDAVGWELKKIAGKKKISLELGGNGAAILDRGQAGRDQANKLALGAFMYSGQICISTQRIYVHQDDYQSFCQEFIEATKKIKMGNPDDETTIVGPLINMASKDRLVKMIDEALSQGAQLLYRDENQYTSELCLGPVILTKTNSKMPIVNQEVFGPIVIVEPYSSFEDALSEVNSSRYGLQAGVFTDSLERLNLAYRTLKVGAVIANEPPGFRVDSMPYGGVKDSGQGREGIAYAITEMTEPKLLVF